MRPLPRQTPRSAAVVQRVALAGAAGERGVSVLELIVSLALLSVVSLLFYQSYIGSLRASQFLESHGDLARYGQKVVNELKSELVQSRYMYQNDALGNGYRAALALPVGLVLEWNSRLPQIDANGNLEPDAPGQTRVGNSLLVARQLPPLQVPVDLNGDGTVDPVQHLADRYQLVYYCLVRSTAQRFPPVDYYLDLVEAKSPVFADFFQLNGLTAGARQQVGQQLYAQGVRKAWDPAQPIGAAFYALDAAGVLTGPEANPAIDMSETRSLIPQLRSGRISGAMAYSVGLISDTPIASPEPIFLFGQQTGRFPGGFEVLVVGPAGARRIMVRLVLLSSYGDKVNSHVNFVTANAIQL